MHYRLGFSSKLENPSVYIECSVRKPGIRHPVREIVKRFGKKKDLLAQDLQTPFLSCGTPSLSRNRLRQS